MPPLKPDLYPFNGAFSGWAGGGERWRRLDAPERRSDLAQFRERAEFMLAVTALQRTLQGKGPARTGTGAQCLTGGERGIRTLGTGEPVRRISNPVHSTTLPSLRVLLCGLA